MAQLNNRTRSSRWRNSKTMRHALFCGVMPTSLTNFSDTHRIGPSNIPNQKMRPVGLRTFQGMLGSAHLPSKGQATVCYSMGGASRPAFADSVGQIPSSHAGIAKTYTKSFRCTKKACGILLFSTLQLVKHKCPAGTNPKCRKHLLVIGQVEHYQPKAPTVLHCLQP